MEFTKKENGMWLNGDAPDERSRIYLSGREYPTYPETIEAKRIGHICLVKDVEMAIPTQELNYEGRYRCGETPYEHGGGWVREEDGKRRWAACAFFLVYSHVPDIGSKTIVIVENHGGGTFFYYVDQLDFHDNFLRTLEAIPESAVWDILHAMIGSWHEGRQYGRDRTSREYAEAFVEGRLKKRKKGDVVRVEIKPRES